jgi:beta-lactamase class A
MPYPAHVRIDVVPVMRKLLTIIVYTTVILLLGRNLSFLPKFYLFTTEGKQNDQFTQQLKQTAKQTIKDAPGNYSVYFSDFNNPHSFGINEKEIFVGASVNKMPIVAVLYSLDHQKKLDLDEKVTIQEDDIQAYGTGSLQYQDPGGSYSLKTLAKLSLQQSDNTAAHVLAKRIGMPVIQKTIGNWGLTQTDMENNKTSAYDMYLLFKKIYKSEITSVAKTQELFGFMIDTDIEDRLPARMRNDVNVYHKTGDHTGSLHDVGIIQKDGTVFFLAVFTSDIGSEETKTKKTIADLAKNILEAYERRD